jgi:hypothetical protein
MKITDPLDNEKIIIVGCLIAENMGIDETFESIEEGTEVVIVGKSEGSNIEDAKGYHVKTDENGYYFLENVPKGNYVIKGARVFIANSFSINIISEWRTLETSYFVPYLQEELIRHDVKYFPASPKGRIYNWGITYFGLSKGSEDPGPAGASNHVLYQHYLSLNNQKINIGKEYNKPDPVTYFKQKFPKSKWFYLSE